MTVQATYTLEIDGGLTVRYTDDLLNNVTHGLTSIATLADDIHCKLLGLRPYDKVIFRIPSRSLLPYRLVEHLVHFV